ncbi:hypothetical protein ATANTOWER_024362, partial [Ataeniobius toweri]|nr:hypothetical protein [Ataeniobius toweri]
QQDLDAVQSISAGYSVKKDPEEAAKCREKGNSSFKAKDYKAAALHYSQGICFAPQSSEQLSLCYANRSAALCHLQHYQQTKQRPHQHMHFKYASFNISCGGFHFKL